jgi:glutathione peroxidase-family protein
LQIFLIPKLGKELFSFISQSQDFIDSDAEKYSKIKNITADFCMVIKLHRLITVEYKDASSIYKFFHSKIRRGNGKVQVKVNFTLELATKPQRGRRGF